MTSSWQEPGGTTTRRDDDDFCFIVFRGVDYTVRHLTANSFLSAEIEAACLRMARLHIYFGQSHSILRCETMGQRAQCKGEQTACTKKIARVL